MLGSPRSTNHAIARSKSYPLADSASSSSEGARVEPKTEERTSNGVIPSDTPRDGSGGSISGFSIKSSLPSMYGGMLGYGQGRLSKSESVIGWNDGGEVAGANGSNGSSSSSSGRADVRSDELGVRERGRRLGDRSAMRGAAIARLEVALGELWAQRSGGGVSVRKK